MAARRKQRKTIVHRIRRLKERLDEHVRERFSLYAIVAALFLIFLYQGYAYANAYWFRPGYVSNVTVDKTGDLLFNYEITRYPSAVEVKTIQPDSNITLGFVTDPWNLNFGIVPFNGSYEKRQVVLFNSNDEKVKVSVVAFGGISPLVDVPGNDIVLGAKQTADMGIYLRTYTYPEGNYSGEIDIVVKKAWNPVGSLFIQ